MYELGRRVKELRLAHGFTVQELATRAGLAGANVISHIEHGGGLRPSTLYHLAKALDADPLELARLLMVRVEAKAKQKEGTL